MAKKNRKRNRALAWARVEAQTKQEAVLPPAPLEIVQTSAPGGAGAAVSVAQVDLERQKREDELGRRERELELRYRELEKPRRAAPPPGYDEPSYEETEAAPTVETDQLLELAPSGRKERRAPAPVTLPAQAPSAPSGVSPVVLVAVGIGAWLLGR